MTQRHRHKDTYRDKVTNIYTNKEGEREGEKKIRAGRESRDMIRVLYICKTLESHLQLHKL